MPRLYLQIHNDVTLHNAIGVTIAHPSASTTSALTLYLCEPGSIFAHSINAPASRLRSAAATPLDDTASLPSTQHEDSPLAQHSPRSGPTGAAVVHRKSRTGMSNLPAKQPQPSPQPATATARLPTRSSAKSALTVSPRSSSNEPVCRSRRIRKNTQEIRAGGTEDEDKESEDTNVESAESDAGSEYGSDKETNSASNHDDFSKDCVPMYRSAKSHSTIISQSIWRRLISADRLPM